MAFDLKKFTTDIAANLTGWSVRPQKPEDLNPGSWQHLDGPNGATLSLFLNEREGKVEVSPTYPNKDGHWYPSRYHNDNPRPGSINVGLTRTPKAAAADIQRRLIEAYLPVYEEGRKQLAARVDYEQRTRATVADIAAVLNEEDPSDRTTTVTRYVRLPGTPEDEKSIQDNTVHVEVRVNSPTSVDLRFSSLPVDVAKQILALFPKVPKGVRAY